MHGLKPSFARGGLSNGWGASVLPYHAKDFEGWPIGLADLAPHYQAIAPVIGMAAAAHFAGHGADSYMLALDAAARF